MANSTVDLEMTRGDTMKFHGEIVPGVGQTFSTPIASLKFSAKKKYQDSAVVFQKTIGSGVSITAQSSSSITYTGQVDAADTEALDIKVKKLLYDLQLTEADGTVSTPVGGEISILPDVTPP